MCDVPYRTKVTKITKIMPDEIFFQIKFLPKCFVLMHLYTQYAMCNKNELWTKYFVRHLSHKNDEIFLEVTKICPTKNKPDMSDKVVIQMVFVKLKTQEDILCL